MYKIMLFVDLHFPPADECLKKVVTIAHAYKLPIELLVDLRKPHLERWYWPEFLEKYGVGDKPEEEANKLILSIQQILDKDDVKSTVTFLNKSAFSDQFHKLHGNSDNCLLLICSELKEKARTKFFRIIEIQTPTLVLSRQPWHSPPNLTVAIDPLHENAIETQVDDRLFDQSVIMNKKLKSNLFLLHSCYIPPMAVAFRKQVIQIHKEAVLEFAETKNIDEMDINIISGNPEETIPTWVATNAIDILALGQFRRSTFKQYLIGSTASKLIERMPCDLLLVS